MRRLLPLAVLLALAAAAPAAAFSPVESVPVSDSDARNPVVSHDARFARYIAYEQGADVRVVQRLGPFDVDANQTWRPGRVATIAGASGPDLDGGPNDRPSCVVYVQGGRAYVARLNGTRAKRIAGGGVSDVAVNGDCEKVAYVSARGLFVYDRVIRKHTRVAAGATAPAFGKTNKGQFSYFSYARGGAVFRASHLRTRGRARVRSRRVAEGTNPSPQGRTRFVAFERAGSVFRASETGAIDTVSSGGASDPDISDAGEFVIFTTTAMNLRIPPGGSAIFIWTQRRQENERLSPASVSARNAETSARGNYVFYEGTEPGQQQPRIWMTYLGGR